MSRIPLLRRPGTAAAAIALAAAALAPPAPARASSTPWYDVPAGPARPAAGPAKPAGKDEEKPFDEVVKDAESIPGLFTLWRKDERAWLEIGPDQLGRELLLSPTLESGLGERGLLAAQVLDEFVFELRRNGKQVQLVRRNVRYRAGDAAAIRRAVDRSFSDSIVATARVVSRPHPERNSVLVELKDLFLVDVPLLGYWIESAYRWPYRLDAASSSFGALRSFPENVAIEARLNFAIDRPPVPPLGGNRSPQPEPPVAPPDVRGLTLRVRYDVSELPGSDYRPRLADDRVGHFLAMHQDFSSDDRDTPYVRYVTRWDLRKQDPAAPLSPPVKPIVFWLENAIPVEYRDAIARGVLLWNGAFERIGFKDAIRVEQMPDDASWDPADVRYNTIRWFVSTDAAFAIGPSRVDPYTGQIYDADISFAEAMTRFTRMSYKEMVDPLAAELADGFEQARALGPRRLCAYAQGAGLEAAFGHELLGLGSAGASPEAERAYLEGYLTHVTAHEVGHTLGLRHNFRASTLHLTRDLQDRDLTRDWGITGSVMDYTPVNLGTDGVQGEHWQTSLGPYDHWAIEYAYAPIDAPDTEGERPALAAIAARVAEPQLAYGTDEDAFGNSAVGLDPRTNQWDLGGDPLAFYEGRVGLVHELWTSLEERVARPGEGWQSLRRSYNRGLRELARSLLNATKYVGGISHHRDHVGDPDGRAPYVPVPAAEQRRALDLIARHGFGPDAFRLDPRVVSRLAIDRFWTFEGEVWSTPRQDVPIHELVLGLQSGLLDRLLAPVRLARLQDLELAPAGTGERFRMADLFDALDRAIWSELDAKDAAGGINSFRRNAQREHLGRLVRIALRPADGTPADAATLARRSLAGLRARIARRLAAPHGLDVAARAHLEESKAIADAALGARLERAM